jgi:hypothetical protein
MTPRAAYRSRTTDASSSMAHDGRLDHRSRTTDGLDRRSRTTDAWIVDRARRTAWLVDRAAATLPPVSAVLGSIAACGAGRFFSFFFATPTAGENASTAAISTTTTPTERHTRDPACPSNARKNRRLGGAKRTTAGPRAALVSEAPSRTPRSDHRPAVRALRARAPSPHRIPGTRRRGDRRAPPTRRRSARPAWARHPQRQTATVPRSTSSP